MSDPELKETWEAIHAIRHIQLIYYHTNMDKKSQRQIYIDEIRWMLLDELIYRGKKHMPQRVTVSTQNGYSYISI